MGISWPIIKWWLEHHHQLPSTIEFLRFESFPKNGDTIYIEVEVAEHVPLFKSGPRKGNLNHKKATGRHVKHILSSDTESIFYQYESVTGRCGRCHGESNEWIGWSKQFGNRYRPCGRCGATGKAPGETKTCAT